MDLIYDFYESGDNPIIDEYIIESYINLTEDINRFIKSVDTHTYCESAVDLFYAIEKKNNNQMPVPGTVKSGNNFNYNQYKQDNGTLMQLFKRVTEFVGSIIVKISNFFHSIFMTPDQKDRLNQFKEYLSQHPEYRNKEIKVKDFKKLEKIYGDAIKAVDTAIMQTKKADGAKAAQIEVETNNKVKQILSGLGKSTVTSIKMDAAIRLCESNKGLAKLWGGMLKKDSKAMKAMVDEVGSAQAKKFRRDIKSCGRTLSLHNLKASLFGQRSKTIGDALQNTMGGISTVFGLVGGKKVVRLIGATKGARKIFKHTMGKDGETFRQTTGGLIKGAKAAMTANNAKNAVTKGIDDIKGIFN